LRVGLRLRHEEVGQDRECSDGLSAGDHHGRHYTRHGTPFSGCGKSRLRPAVTTGGGFRVEVDRLTKAFGTSVAIEDVSFAARDHEFVTLVGPSGCGKSTTLRIVAGLLDATAGTVRVNRRDVRGPVTDAAMVFQAPVLLPWRRMVDNILFTAEMRGRVDDDMRARAAGLVELAGLTGAEQRYPHELSGGMQQRVAICRALLLHPSLLLMDEPFGAIDAITKSELHAEFKRVQAMLHRAVVLVTHDISEAFALADRVAVLHDGQIAACDVPDAVRASNDPRVAALVSSAPVLPTPRGSEAG
jgi:NitT/TauT family transport system ATP-binding protein